MVDVIILISLLLITALSLVVIVAYTIVEMDTLNSAVVRWGRSNTEGDSV